MGVGGGERRISDPFPPPSPSPRTLNLLLFLFSSNPAFDLIICWNAFFFSVKMCPKRSTRNLVPSVLICIFLSQKIGPTTHHTHGQRLSQKVFWSRSGSLIISLGSMTWISWTWLGQSCGVQQQMIWKNVQNMEDSCTKPSRRLRVVPNGKVSAIFVSI